MLRRMGLLIALGCSGLAAGRDADRTALHVGRQAATDLEVSGKVRGIPAGESRFISREYLLGLPQIGATVRHSELASTPLDPGLSIQGVYLEELAKSLGTEGEAVAAICSDGYTSTLPASYIREHRPILVLTIEGLTLHDWAAKKGAFDASPYFVGYQHFTASFKVRSHADQPAEPDGMVKIVFDTEERLYAGIAPKRRAGAHDPAQMDGYRIARQNCYRCHNSGANGGTKAGVEWRKMGLIAKKKPKYFEAWVRNPQSIKPTSKMPPNMDYDKATLTALERYFATFAEEGE